MENIDVSSINSALKEAGTEIEQNNNYVKASEILSKLVKEVSGKFKSDNDTQYLSFNTPVEHFIYVNEFKPTAAVHDIEVNIAEIYRLYSKCLYSMNKYEQAEKAVKISLTFNPVYVKSMLLYSDILYAVKEYEKSLEKINDALKHSYLPNDFARCYQYLGMYYADLEHYDESAAIIYYSQAFHNDANVKAALVYLSSFTGKIMPKPSVDAINKVLNEEEIQNGPTQEILDTMYSLAITSFNNANYDLSLFCFKLLNKYIDNKSVKDYIKKIAEVKK